MEPRTDLQRYIVTGPGDVHTIALAVDGLQCGACVWLIESVLARQPGLLKGRVNMTTRRLNLTWNGPIEQAHTYVETIERLGYRLMPFDAAALEAADDRAGRALLRALAVAGFAAGNVMLSSIGVWAGLTHGMGPATRDLLHWLSALIAMPAIAYAGMPFFRSAIGALRQGRTNMDVPISIGVTLVTAMSLVETIQGGAHAYFDSAVSLVFFLLIGRVLDHRARGHVRAVAAQMLMLRCQDIAILQPDGSTRRCPAEQIPPAPPSSSPQANASAPTAKSSPAPPRSTPASSPAKASPDPSARGAESSPAWSTSATPSRCAPPRPAAPPCSPNASASSRPPRPAAAASSSWLTASPAATPPLSISAR